MQFSRSLSMKAVLSFVEDSRPIGYCWDLLSSLGNFSYIKEAHEENDDLTTSSHDDFAMPTLHYRVSMRKRNVSFHPQKPVEPQNLWTFGAAYLDLADAMEDASIRMILSICPAINDNPVIIMRHRFMKEIISKIGFKLDRVPVSRSVLNNVGRMLVVYYRKNEKLLKQRSL